MKTILVVDDNPLHQLWVKEELSHEGYHVITTSSGREALSLAREDKPDLVVLDIRIPDMDGLYLLARFTGSYPRLPVVIHTGYAGYRDNYMTWSAEAYILKSGNADRLKHEIAAVFQRQYPFHMPLIGVQEEGVDSAARTGGVSGGG